MLKGGGDDVLLPLLRPQPGGGANGLVVGLAAAGGEGDLPGIAAQPLGHDGPGRLQGLLGRLSGAVEAGWISVNAVQIGQHAPDGRLTHLGGGGVIGIDVTHGIRFLSPPKGGRTMQKRWPSLIPGVFLCIILAPIS